MAKIDNQLFSAHEHALERDHGNCPECNAPLAIRHGKHGPFLGCERYPACEYHRPLVEKATKPEELLEDTQCPLCSRPLALKSGRYGFYIGCSGFPECDYVVREEPETVETQVPCPECHSGELVARSNRFGKKFFACSAYPRCKYLVNDKPIMSPCPDCGWSILVEKKVRGHLRQVCPQRACKYQSDPI
ncbi:DNA topoisomerase family protein [Ferrimonas gelatinilytica]|uniref:Type I DNA topoisomerase n=1 Tax=Ferrimonas gelatinilytica TaxID=1255257 RepID=A0ABP9SCM6_9GAMM